MWTAHTKEVQTIYAFILRTHFCETNMSATLLTSYRKFRFIKISTYPMTKRRVMCRHLNFLR